jgi:hypothetical protein
MKFEYFVLADAANTAQNGKINVLGMGARIVHLERLPGAAPLAIVGGVEATTADAGDYDLRVSMIEPDDSEQVLVDARATLAADVPEPELPAGIVFTVDLRRPFRQEGVYRLVASFGTATADYSFAVRTTGADTAKRLTSGPAKATRAKASAGAAQ